MKRPWRAIVHAATLSRPNTRSQVLAARRCRSSGVDQVDAIRSKGADRGEFDRNRILAARARWAVAPLAGVAGANSPIELAATGSELVHQVAGERLAASGTLVRE
jgi:hypothetical protein